MTPRILALAIVLNATLALWHVQSLTKRERADMAEQALAWACVGLQVTYAP